MLEGLFGEYHSSSLALGNVLSSQSQLSRVLAGLLAYQVVVYRVQCSTSSGLLSTDFNTLRKSRHLAYLLRLYNNNIPLLTTVLSTEDYFSCLEDNHGNVKDKPCPVWEESKNSQPSGNVYLGC